MLLLFGLFEEDRELLNKLKAAAYHQDGTGFLTPEWSWKSRHQFWR
jgi:hypothetical protein